MINKIKLLLLSFPIIVIALVLPFISYRPWINDYITLHIYGFILSSFCAGMGILFFHMKKKFIWKPDLLTISILALSGYMIFHSIVTSSGNRIDFVYILAFLTLFFVFQSDRGEHLKTVAVFMIIISLVQAVYGIGQSFNFFRYSPTVKGSFDNPAGLAALLCCGVPFCVFLLSFSQRYKLLAYLGFIFILPAIFLSGSRAGIISTVIVLFYYLFIRFKDIILANRKFIIPFCLFLFSLFSTYLFFNKQDSATGRVLIWRNSLQMIAENPVLGIGKHGFMANYMLYQADYFTENPDGKFALLADNVIRPFNEYLLFTIEYGWVGLFLIGWIVFLLFRFSPKGYSPYVGIVIAIIVFSCFSYPLRYPIILLLLAYSLAGLSHYTPSLNKFSYGYFLKGISGLLLLGGFYFTFTDISFELRWKELVRLSSLGKGKEVLEEYEDLYKKWNGNPFFLYNYGAQLNRVKDFEQSNLILDKCKNYFNDYDVQLLLADNYKELGDKQKAIEHYQLALNMCPNRFVPLYEMMKIYEEDMVMEKVEEIAQEIINKSVKIPSYKINIIKEQAKEKVEENR